MNQFIEAVNCSISCIINNLFELGSSKNIGSGIKCATTHINIRIRNVCSIRMTATESYKQKRFSKMLICLKKLIFRTRNYFFNIKHKIFLHYNSLRIYVLIRSKAALRIFLSATTFDLLIFFHDRKCLIAETVSILT